MTTSPDSSIDMLPGSVSSVKVLGIPVFAGNLTDVARIFSTVINGHPRRCLLVSATGAHGLVYANRDARFSEVLCNFALNLPDGMPTVWIGRLKGKRQMARCYGPDFFGRILASTSNSGVRHFFCGGKEGIAEELKSVCESKFGNSNVCGTYSPPFREMTDAELSQLGDYINQCGTDILWIGVSTPKQEMLAYRLSKFVKVHFICTVGAAFDFHSGHVRQAPPLMQQLGLEWLFRLMVEPRRLWKRYMVIVPLFILYNLQEFFNFAWKKIKGN